MKVIHVPDLHIPFHDKRATAEAIGITLHERPDHIVFAGDIVDCYAASKYVKQADKLYPLQKEFDKARDVLAQFQAAAPKAALHLTCGNHEARIAKYVARNAPGLAGIRGLEIETLLSDPRYEMLVYPEGRGPTLGGIFFTHGDKVRSGAGNTVRALLQKIGRHVAIGHSHRMGAVAWRQGNRVLWGWESGTLSTLRPEYELYQPDWQQGLSVFVTGGRVPLCQQIPLPM